jgi:hypothetical protein
MTEPESHTLAYLRRIDEKLDRFHGNVGERFDRIEGRLDRVEGRLSRIEDELLVLNGIALRLEGREMEATRLEAILDRHERWLGELRRRLLDMEGAKERPINKPGHPLSPRCHQGPSSSAPRDQHFISAARHMAGERHPLNAVTRISTRIPGSPSTATPRHVQTGLWLGIRSLN